VDGASGGSDGQEQEEDGEDGEDEDGEEMEKSGFADATEILKSLVGELKEVNKSLAAISSRQDGVEKAQADIGEAVVGVAELVSKIANSPLSPKTVMSKGGLGSGAGNGSPAVLSVPEFEQAQAALAKAFRDRRISLHQSARLESEMQKAMNIAGYRMKPEDLALINREIKTA